MAAETWPNERSALAHVAGLLRERAERAFIAVLVRTEPGRTMAPRLVLANASSEAIEAAIDELRAELERRQQQPEPARWWDRD